MLLYFGSIIFPVYNVLGVTFWGRLGKILFRIENEAGPLILTIPIAALDKAVETEAIVSAALIAMPSLL
jgi:hypothetical protein